MRRCPPPPRSISGKYPAVAAPLDLDDASELELSAPLDLDLPSHDPLHRRVSSSGMPAVRPAPSEPPVASAGRSPVPARGSSFPPASPTPVAMASPPVSGSGAPSVPPVSRASWAAPGSQPPAALRWKFAAEAHATWVERLLPGGVVLASAILVTILDQLYSKVSGEIFTLGGLRTSVLAGLVMLLGIGLCLYRLKRD